MKAIISYKHTLISIYMYILAFFLQNHSNTIPPNTPTTAEAEEVTFMATGPRWDGDGDDSVSVTKVDDKL